MAEKKKTTAKKEVTKKVTEEKIEKEEKVAASEPKKEEKTFSKEEVDRMVKEAVANAMKQFSADSPNAPVFKVTPDEYVTVIFMGAIANGTSVALGKLGKINRAGIPQKFPKKDFLENMGIPVVDALLRKKELIVVNGLEEDERERFGLQYTEKELLSPNALFKLMDYGKDEITSIFRELCPAHQKIVSKMYLSEYFEKNNPTISTETVKELNEISKAIDKDGLFTPILEDMGDKLSK